MESKNKNFLWIIIRNIRFHWNYVYMEKKFDYLDRERAHRRYFRNKRWLDDFINATVRQNSSVIDAYSQNLSNYFWPTIRKFCWKFVERYTKFVTQDGGTNLSIQLNGRFSLHFDASSSIKISAHWSVTNSIHDFRLELDYFP